MGVILSEAETKCSLASVSAWSEATGEMPLRVIAAVIEHWLLAKVRLRALHSGTSMAAVFY